MVINCAFGFPLRSRNQFRLPEEKTVTDAERVRVRELVTSLVNTLKAAAMACVRKGDSKWYWICSHCPIEHPAELLTDNEDIVKIHTAYCQVRLRIVEAREFLEDLKKSDI